MQTLGVPTPAALAPGSTWRLEGSLPGWSQPQGTGLATEVAAGRHLRLLDGRASEAGRLRVRLLEDGYPCWLDGAALLDQGQPAAAPPLPRLRENEIQSRLPRLLQLADQARQRPNTYLWGGTLGPDFDCSGLIQTLFAAVGVWLPRDAYLQERFCQPVAVQIGRAHV